MRILGVGDGDRDCAMMEPIVRNLHGAPLTVTFKPRKAYRVGGYGKVMTMALLEAFDDGFQGVVFWADEDSGREPRLKELRDARNQSAVIAQTKAAIGIAAPHAEAWILDDAHSVRAVLGLPNDHAIPKVSESNYPKTTLDDLCHQHRPQDPVMNLLPEFGAQLALGRMREPDRTGFSAFEKDFKDQFRK